MVIPEDTALFANKNRKHAPLFQLWVLAFLEFAFESFPTSLKWKTWDFPACLEYMVW